MSIGKQRASALFGLVSWTAVTIHLWCHAVLDGFSGNSVFQITVASVLLMGFQAMAVFASAEGESHSRKSLSSA